MTSPPGTGDRLPAGGPVPAHHGASASALTCLRCGRDALDPACLCFSLHGEVFWIGNPLLVRHLGDAGMRQD